MRARKCDRCGNFYDTYKGKKPTRANSFMFLDRDENNRYYEREIYDLCPECIDALVSFMEKGNK